MLLVNIFDGRYFGLYTGNYENIRQVFYATINRRFYHVTFGTDWFGMDVANNVHNEIVA